MSLAVACPCGFQAQHWRSVGRTGYVTRSASSLMCIIRKYPKLGWYYDPTLTFLPLGRTSTKGSFAVQFWKKRLSGCYFVLVGYKKQRLQHQ